MRSLPLGQLLADAGVTVEPSGDGATTCVTSVTHDSRRVVPGALFCCVPGATTDGHEHAPAAVAAGAVALVVERPLDLPVPQVLVASTRAVMGPIAAAFHGHPSRRLTVLGVTGTNGKTTVTHLAAAILGAHGWPTGVIGTLSGQHTTPEAPDLQARLAAFADGGTRAVAMEVSSHALDQQRVAGTRFAVSVFTNLSRDHLDYHGTMERYFAAKARLFEPELSDRAVLCVDDPHGRLLMDTVRIPAVAYSLGDAGEVEIGAAVSSCTWRGATVHLPLGGRFNLLNALGAATAAVELGVPVATVAEALATVTPVPGRFERIVGSPPFAAVPFEVIVDYAHTPDGLDAVLTAARQVAPGGRVLVVVGAGGDRDRTKRPAMGEVAARLADRVVVTSDNPRSEDPAAIIEEIVAGVAPEHRRRVLVEPDRRSAIALALADAGRGDVVVVAGKGHETTQTIGGRQIPFDDRAVVREVLVELGFGEGEVR